MTDENKEHPAIQFIKTKYPFLNDKGNTHEEQLYRFDVFLGAMRQLSKDTLEGGKDND